MESCYPFETRLAVPADGDCGGWSILLVNLHQRVQSKPSAWHALLGSGLRRQVGAYLERARGLGWTLHPYLRQPHGVWLRERPFDPMRALSPSTHDALFGPPASFPAEPIAAADGGTAADADGELAAMVRRLDRGAPGCPHQQPVLLTRAAPGQRAGHAPGPLDGELLLCRRTGGQGRPDAEPEGSIVFRIQWADLWLFPDANHLVSTQNALLAFKVVPLRVIDAAGAARDVRVGDLAELNRALRDLDRGERGGALVRPFGGDEPPANLWGLILEHWLGVAMDQRNRVAAAADDAHGMLAPLFAACRRLPRLHPWCPSPPTRPNLLALQTSDRVFADRYTDYAKVLTAAAIPPPAGGQAQGPAAADIAWDLPQTLPTPNAARIAAEIGGGTWSAEQTAMAQSRALGYPTLGDALLYELATTSSEGSVLGLGADATRDWCVSPEYMRTIFGQSGIELWADWKGLALRDGCAFLAWHPKMPILGQGESHYYPLYVHTYYSQLRLHDFSEGIIEHELADLRRARILRQAFMQFRNQFWFREPATRFQGIAVADAMRAGMGLGPLYDSVSAEVEQVGSYVDQKTNAARQKLIALLVVLIWPMGILTGIYEDELTGLESRLHALSPWWMAAGFAAFVAVVIGLYIVLAERVALWLTRLGDWFLRKGV